MDKDSLPEPFLDDEGRKRIEKDKEVRKQIEESLKSASKSDLENGMGIGFMAAVLKESYPDYHEFIEEKVEEVRKSNQDEDLAEIMTVEDLITSYEQFTSEIPKYRIQLGYSEIDKEIRGIAPGEVLGFVARTSVGKSIFAENCIRNVIGNHNVPVMFFSLEQDAPQAFERLAAIDYDKRPVEIEELFTIKVHQELVQRILDSYGKRLLTSVKNDLSFSQMEKLIVRAQEMLGESIGLVIIDYLGYMRAKGKDAYERTSRLAKELKTFAKQRRVAVLVLHQLSREALSGGGAVSLRMCRDSGVFEESCDYLLGAWRPELAEHISQEEQLTVAGEFKVAILKNRCGGNKVVSLKFNPKNLRIE